MSIETPDRPTLAHGRATCGACGASDGASLIERCVSCRSHFCMRCAYRWHGKRFCSRPCAEVFFFGDGDHDGD